MSRIFYRLVAVLCFSCSFSLSAQANWQLDNSQSTLHFVSIKKSAIAETHTFKQLSGEVSQQGNAVVTIDLASVDTKIDIRNQRMNQHLFEVAQFPKAKITTNIDMKLLTSIKVGETVKLNQNFKIDLHGHQVEVAADCLVVKLADNQIRVSSVEPMLVSATQFGLVKGIAKLAELAKLPSIATAVPVTFNLVFKY